MSTDLTPSRRDNLRPVNHILAVINGAAAGAVIALVAMVVLLPMSNGGLERCQVRHSLETCLYALR